MDPAAASTSAGMQMRERRARESSYHPMASDSDDDGQVSDGDPPFYANSSHLPPLDVASVVVANAATAPPAAAATGYAPTRPPNVNNASLVGTAGGAATVIANPAKKAGKRSFEELEDIVFSNPRSFATLAFAIAESRGVTLIVTDDRTHKVTSAYMHITCAFRKSGCPFILKLTKAKEGGWVLKGAKTLEVELKQRSVYRCRHPAGAVPEIPTAQGSFYPALGAPSGSTPGPGSGSQSSSSYPTSNSIEVGGGVSKPKAAKLEPHDSAVAAAAAGKVVARGPGRPPRSAAPSLPALGRGGGYGTPPPPNPVVVGGGSSSRMTPISTLPPPPASAPPSADRALAPPFARSLDLQSKIVPVLRGGEPTTGFSAPRGGGGGGGGGFDSNYNSPRASVVNAGGAAGGSPRGGDFDHRGVGLAAAAADPTTTTTTTTTLATVPVIAHSDPQALPDWTKLLRLLSPPQPTVDVEGPRASSDTTSTSSSSSSSVVVPNGNNDNNNNGTNGARSRSPNEDPAAASDRPRRHRRRPGGGGESASEAAPAPSLVPLAQVLSHPYMSVTPGLFYSKSTTSEMRLEVLQGLPVDKVGVWNKVWAKHVLMSREAEDKWNEVVRARAQRRRHREDDDDEDDYSGTTTELRRKRTRIGTREDEDEDNDDDDHEQDEEIKEEEDGERRVSARRAAVQTTTRMKVDGWVSSGSEEPNGTGSLYEE